MFVKTYKKKPDALKFPVMEVERTDGTIVRGVVSYAENWNPPPGCLRIQGLESFKTKKDVFKFILTETLFAPKRTKLYTTLFLKNFLT